MTSLFAAFSAKVQNVHKYGYEQYSTFLKLYDIYFWGFILRILYYLIYLEFNIKDKITLSSENFELAHINICLGLFEIYMKY